MYRGFINTMFGACTSKELVLQGTTVDWRDRVQLCVGPLCCDSRVMGLDELYISDGYLRVSIRVSG